MLAILILGSLPVLALSAGIGTAWDISPRETIGAHPAWSKSNLSAFEVRTISGVGALGSEASKREAKEIDDMANDYVPEILFDQPVFKGIVKKPKQHPDVEMLPGPWEKSRREERIGRSRQGCPESLENEDLSSAELTHTKPRIRREVREQEGTMEKMSGTKNMREARLSSPESWSKQPLSVEFRHRTNLESGSAEDEESLKSSMRGHRAPQTDFVTANRRSFSSEARESRDLPMARSYDEGSTYRNSLKDYRDYDVPHYSRGYFYPDHFRTERDYFIRGVNEPVFSPDRYRIEDYDMYRNRPTPKPKRIIYYATLPEIVRKPIDTRRLPYDYRPSYDDVSRASSIPPMTRDPIYRRIPDSKYRYRDYSYDSYDPYTKRNNYWDRRPYQQQQPHDRIDESRYREQDLDHASFKEAPNTDENFAKFDNYLEDKLPWPVKIGTEINIKESERITGRKVFAQNQDYERLRKNPRMEREGNDADAITQVEKSRD